jgi:L-glutamine-phosphate cytidylyltransferase
MSTPRKALIIAAGMGRRLAPYTDEMPKCLVPVRGKPMLVRQLEAFRAHGVERFVIIRGYKADVLERRKGELGDGVSFVENAEYQSNNILQSMFKAAHELEEPLYVTYADIVFAHDVVGKLAAAAGDFSLIVDRDFAKISEGRTQHPLPEAEVCAVEDGRITAVGKRSVPVEQAYGEFIGLAKLTRAGAARLGSAYAQLATTYAGRESEPFGRNTWRGAYLTDLFEHLIGAGETFRPVDIHGQWREIDTTQDLERAEAQVDW